MPRACVVIPTRNEAASIAAVIAQVREGLNSTQYNDVVILVVDDSSDDTRRLALEAGAEVMPGGGDGLGTAMYRGLKGALLLDPDVILAIDGDGQADTAREIPRFLDPIDRNVADLVLGSRFHGDAKIHYEYPFINRFGTRVLSAMLRRQTGLNLTDSHGGIRAMRPEVVADLEMLGTHTYVQETILDAVEKGYRVTEIPSSWLRRKDGKSRVVGSISTYVLYTLPILLLRSGEHIRFLYSAGIGLVLIGFICFLAVLFQEQFSYRALLQRTPAFTLIALLTTVGVQLFGLGFVLQLLKQMKKAIDRVDNQIRGQHVGAIRQNRFITRNERRA